MTVKSGAALAGRFVTSSSAGAATNADSLPTGTLVIAGDNNGATVTVANQATGDYKWSVTCPSLTAGQSVQVVIAATVGGVAAKAVVFGDVADTSIASDIATTIGAAGAGLTAVGDTAGTTTLLTRLTSTRAGYLDNLSAGAVALASSLTTLQTDVTTLLSRVTGAVSLATATTAAAIRSALGMAAANLDTQLDTLPTAAENADAIWDEALAGHATAGSAGKALSDAAASGNPWDTDIEGEAFADGTAGDILQGLAGGTVYATGSTPNTDADLYIRRGDTVAVTIGDLTGLSAGWDVLWVTIKRSEHDADSAAILQVRLNVATPTLPGLLYINGQTPTDAGVAATDAWISDVDAGADTLVLNIKPAASLLLPARGQLWFDVQQLDGTTITSLATGEKTAEIGADITRATS